MCRSSNIMQHKRVPLLAKAMLNKNSDPTTTATTIEGNLSNLKIDVRKCFSLDLKNLFLLFLFMSPTQNLIKTNNRPTTKHYFS